MINNKISIKSFRDLDVYQNTYKAMLIVMREILPKLPDSERYDLRDQLSRSCKAVPRLIAEGFAKKHQKAGFQKYIDDAMAECNETIVGIEQARDIYNLGKSRCDEIIDLYDKSARQLFNLAKAWDSFKNSRITTPKNDTGCDTEKRITTNGFTLVEIALVVGILVVLSSIVLVTLNIRGNSAQANNVKRKIDLESIQKALDLRAQETGDSLPAGLSSGLSERCVGTGSDAYNLSSLSWTESAGDPDIKFDVRSCDDDGCNGETWPGTPAFSSSPATLNITNAPYFQYKATFNAPELAWTQTTNENFNGTNASTAVNGGSVNLAIQGSDTTNIALNKSASAGSTYSTGYPSNAVDGNNSTRWVSNISGADWFKVDLNGSYAIRKIRVKYKGNTGSSYFNLYSSLDNVTYTLIDAGPNAYADYDRTIIFTPLITNARYIKAEMNGSYYKSIYELEVYQPVYFSSGAYTSLPQDLLGTQTFTSISWNISDSNDGEITLGDANLKGLWHFNENTGAIAKDALSVNNGTITGTNYWTSPGKFGAAFNGSGDDYTTINDNNALDIGTGDWSVEAWFKLSGGGGTRTILSKDDLYDLKINGSGQVVAGIYDPTDADQIVATNTTPISDTNWHHAVLVFSKSAGRVNLYIDGKLDGTAAISPAAIPSDMSNSSNLRIGADGAGANAFSGSIDEVAFWSKALAAPATDCATDEPKISYDSYQYEICQHYNKGTGIPHLKFQARSCNDSACDPLLPTPSTEDFVGPDGTSSTYYNSIGSYGSGSALNLPNNQFVQYKADFVTSDTSKTPSLDAISIKYLSSAKPQLLDAMISGASAAFGTSNNFANTTYSDFNSGIFNASEFTIRDSANPSDSASGLVEYKGGTNISYTSTVFSGSCYNLTTDLAPLYLGTIPKDPKIGTDANTGYLISVDQATKVVCVKAPGAENDEVIENCRK